MGYRALALGLAPPKAHASRLNRSFGGLGGSTRACSRCRLRYVVALRWLRPGRAHGRWAASAFHSTWTVSCRDSTCSNLLLCVAVHSQFDPSQVGEGSCGTSLGCGTAASARQTSMVIEVFVRVTGGAAGSEAAMDAA
eukprot:359303-Chlamydomonas_euryale.AAC.4